MTLRDLLNIFLKDAQITLLKKQTNEIDEQEKKDIEEHLIDRLIEDVKERMIG